MTLQLVQLVKRANEGLNTAKSGRWRLCRLGSNAQHYCYLMALLGMAAQPTSLQPVERTKCSDAAAPCCKIRVLALLYEKLKELFLAKNQTNFPKWYTELIS